MIFDLPESLVIRDDDPPDYCPCPPDGRTRVIEAVVIATLNVITAKAVEHFYWKLFPPKTESTKTPETK